MRGGVIVEWGSGVLGQRGDVGFRRNRRIPVSSPPAHTWPRITGHLIPDVPQGLMPHCSRYWATRTQKCARVAMQRGTIFKKTEGRWEKWNSHVYLCEMAAFHYGLHCSSPNVCWKRTKLLACKIIYAHTQRIYHLLTTPFSFHRAVATVQRWASAPLRSPWRSPCQGPLFTSSRTPVPKITSSPMKFSSSFSRNSRRLLKSAILYYIKWLYVCRFSVKKGAFLTCFCASVGGVCADGGLWWSSSCRVQGLRRDCLHQFGAGLPSRQETSEWGIFFDHIAVGVNPVILFSAGI